MTALHVPAVKATLRGLAFALAALSSGAALAAPNNNTFNDCVSSVQWQYQLDQSACLIYLAEQRALCIAQATQRYADGMAGCGLAASRSSSIRKQVSPALKQNVDSAFVRRLRF